jgi:hypothetical protein
VGGDGALGAGPTPELAAQPTDECGRHFGLLHAESLRSVAQWEGRGLTNEEIAARAGRVRHTVDGKLQAIPRVQSKGEPP